MNNLYQCFVVMKRGVKLQTFFLVYWTTNPLQRRDHIISAFKFDTNILSSHNIIVKPRSVSEEEWFEKLILTEFKIGMGGTKKMASSENLCLFFITIVLAQLRDFYLWRYKIKQLTCVGAETNHIIIWLGPDLSNFWWFGQQSALRK